MRHTYHGTAPYFNDHLVDTDSDGYRMAEERRAKCEPAPTPRGSLDAARQVRDAFVNAAAKVRDEQGAN